MEDLLSHLLVPSNGRLLPASLLPPSSLRSSENDPEVQAAQGNLGNTYLPLNRSVRIGDHQRSSQDDPKPLDTSRKRKMSMMDMDSPPSAQAVANVEPSPFANVSGNFMADGLDLQSIEDFDLENPWHPKPKIVAVAAPKVNMQDKIVLCTLCQKLALIAEFDVREFAPQSFAGKIKIGSTIFIEDKGPFRSKKEVEAALAKTAIPLVQDLQSKGLTLKHQEVTARKTMAEQLRSENWIGTLQNYVQAHVRGYAVPTYQEYETNGKPIQFACTVTFPGAPLTPFVPATELWPSKSEARKAAAREAVIWLRSQGAFVPVAQVLPSPPAKKLKGPEALAEVDGVDKTSTGLTQALTAVDVDAVSNDSLATRVHNMVAFLGFLQPTWETQPSQPPSGILDRSQNLGGFCDMACIFNGKDVAKEPRLAGRIGKVKNVYGKKKAKDMCCLEVLRVLEQIKASR